MMRACRRWHALLRGVFMHLSSYQNVPSTWSWRNAASHPGRVLFARLELGLWNSVDNLGYYPNVSELRLFKGDRWWEWERRQRTEDGVAEFVAIASAFPNISQLTFCCPYIPGRSMLAKIFPRLRIVRGAVAL